MRLASLVTVLAVLAPAVASAQQDTADIVFTNGKVYTANEKQARADAVAIKGNKIVFVGRQRRRAKIHRTQDQGDRPAGGDGAPRPDRLPTCTSPAWASAR